MEHLYIQMLGDFSLRNGENVISDSQNRTKKVWLLLAFILCKKGKLASRKELINLLWGEDATSNNPENALKITFYRVRSLLDQLEPNAGHQLVVWQDNGYTWNMSVPVTLDTEEFEKLCAFSNEDSSLCLARYMEAIDLYKGDFLSNLSNEDWILPFTTHYHNLYIETVLKTVPLLSDAERHEEAIAVLKKAISMEPYHELLYQLLMQEYMAIGNQTAAVSAYDTLSQRLFSDFGTKPGNEIYEIYRTVMQTLTDKSLTMDSVLDYLTEKGSDAGALKCDYDYFKILCHSEARISARSGVASHIVLMSVSGKSDKILSKKSLNQAMDQIGENIRLSLRRGDAYTQCSINQYIIMLREANYDNSCMVSRRIVNAFAKAHPRSSAQISYKVELLTPSTVMK